MSLIKHTVIYIVYIFFTLKLIIAQVDNILILMFKYLGNKMVYTEVKNQKQRLRAKTG